MINQGIFIKANNALAKGDYDEFIAYCTDDVKWENVGKSSFKGKAELLSYISSVYKGITFTTENSVREDDFIVEFGQLTIENSGELRKSSYCDIWKFKGALISQLTSFMI